MDTLNKKKTSLNKTQKNAKLRLFFNDFMDMDYQYSNLESLKNYVETISKVTYVKGVEILCTDVDAESEQKTEEETDAVSCSDVADATSQDKPDIF